MSEYCLIDVLGVTALCIEMYILIGIVLAIIGVLIAIFLPTSFSRKLGGLFLLIGLSLSVLFPLIFNLWNDSMIFQMIVYTLGTFLIVMVILFPDTKIPFTEKKR